MFDAVCAKQAVIKQLTSRSTEMVENWKQSTRDSRAEILGNRKRVMDQISFETIKLTPCKPSDSESTIEAKYSLCMQEIKEKSETPVVEAWKSKAIESRRLIFATMHNIVAEIKTEKNLQKKLKSTKKINRQDLMEDLKSQVEKQPEWKAKITTQKTEAIRNKNLVNCDIREFKFELNSTKNQVQKFNAVLEQIRVPTESWKNKNRAAIADPHKNLKLVVAEISENNFSLASTKNPREQLMMAIREKSHEIEAWKQTKADSFSKHVQARRAVLCDISEKKFTLKKIANRQALLAQVRAAYNIPESWTFLESWKENIRNQKSKILIAHKNCMVSLEQFNKFNLKPTQQSTRKEQLRACLENIRKEPVEAWKQKIQDSRVSTYENKKALNSEISEFDVSSLKPVEKSVQARKLEVNEQIKSKFGRSMESWKQKQMNNKSVQFYNKHLMMNQLISVKKSNLKKTESIEQTKTSLMAAIRAKTNSSPVPEWQESERIERSKVQNNRNLVLSELRSVKKPVLGETKSLEQVRMQICKEIRARREPIEAWKEKEREIQAELYNNKRTVMQAIANGVNCVGNRRNQADLKDALMLEIRSKGAFVVPEWKEKRMAVRAKVLKNKVALNVAICALKN